MRENFWKTAAKEVGLSAALATVFCLLAEALLAVFVRAYALSEASIIVSNLVLKSAAAFVFPLLAVRGERALFKGMAAGFLFLLLTTLLFGLIGGFRFSPLFCLDVLLCVLAGGGGAAFGRKLRKE